MQIIVQKLSLNGHDIFLTVYFLTLYIERKRDSDSKIGLCQHRLYIYIDKGFGHKHLHIAAFINRSRI
jgi:hypothetical protein